MNALSPLVCVALGTLALACSSSSSPAATMEAGTSEDAGLTTEESASFDTLGGSFSVNQETALLADDLFDFDPTIVPANSASQNAAAIGAHTKTSLGSSCGSVSVSGASVAVAFGPPPGCTLANGVVVSGTVDLAVSKSGTTTTVALTLTSVVANGEPLSGTASFATTNGSTFAVTTDLMSSTKTDTANLTVTGQTGSFVVSGNSTVTESTGTSDLTFTGVTVTQGECYATAGSIAIVNGSVDETITFDAETPSTGQVMLQIGKHTTTTTLPPYGSCPSGGGRDAGRDSGHDTGRDR